MLKKLSMLILTAVLTSSFCHAQESSVDETKPTPADNSTAIVAKMEARRNQKVRTDVLNLIADVKAGKVVPATRLQLQPQNRNNLSTGTKVAIAVGAAVTIVAIIIYVKAPKGPSGSIKIF